MKLLIRKQRSAVLFLLTILIFFGIYSTGYGQAVDPPLRERTPQIRNAIVAAVPGVNNADDVTAAHLAAITKLNPIFRGITSLKSGDFNGLTALTFLGLSANELTSLPPGIFDELTALTYLGLSSNKLSALPPGVFDELTALKTLALSINKLRALPPGIFDELTALNYLGLGANKLRALPSGIFNELTALKTLFLHSDNISDISELEGLTALTALQLSRNPISDYGPIHRLVAAITAAGGSLKLDITIPAEFAGGDGTPPAGAGIPASAPVFTEGTTAIRTVAENTASGANIGTAVAATDADNDTLTYTLGGTDAASFSIVSTSGQLQTNAALDYETKRSYAVSITVSDTKLTASIDVRINVTNVNEAPSFTDGTSTTRTVAENTASEQNIGSAVAATDVDADTTLTYTLSGADAASFSIISTSGQLQTSAALDFETKRSYSVRITVSDGQLTDSINVRINVTDVAENGAPAFAEGTSTTRSVAENTGSGQDIGNPVSATDPDTSDTLTYTLSGADASSFSINSTNGQLQTNAALDYETQKVYAVSITVSDTKLTNTIDVRISVSNVNEAPSFATSTATRSIAENTAANTNIGSAFTATDVDADTTLTYTLGGTDAASFSINSTNGQLQTNAALDFERKRSYSVRITVSDGQLTDSIDVTINVSNVNEAPSFTEGTSATRTVAENTATGQNIGAAVAATDVDADTILTYTLGGTDAAAFSINSANGQLQTNAALDFERKRSYSVRITVSDGQLTDSIDVRIDVTDVGENRAPTFTEDSPTTRSVAENTATGQNIGTAISATDADTDDTLTYTLSGTDAEAFRIVSTSGQLQTRAALDYERKTSYSVTVSVSDDKGSSDSISVRINVTNVNEAPSFTDGTSTTRTIAENTAANTNIGSAFTATDVDADTTLTYTLSGADAASFGIVSTSGQLQTNAALDFERKSSYSVTITVSDGQLTDSIDVRINVIDVDENRAPAFTDGDNTTRSVAENTASGQSIGNPVSATDPDTGDVLTYTLSGADEASFSIVSTSGQLQTQAPLDYENKKSYSLTVSVSDGNGGSDSITVAINVTDVEEPVEQPATPPASGGTPPLSTPPVQTPVEPNNAPVFSDGSPTTRSIAENTDSGVSIGTPVSATDADNDSLTYTLGGTDAAAFSIVSTSGQLQTSAALDYETKKSYAVTVSVSDGKGGSDSIDVTINVTDVGERARQVSNNAPVFTEGDNATRTIAENKAAGTNIGSPIAATDADTGDTLIYSLGGTDEAYFSIVSTNGQLRTRYRLNYEIKISYSVTVLVSDGNGGTDSISVTIDVTNVNEAPSFTGSTIRTIVENTAAGMNIGSPVSATDQDRDDTLTYTVRGPDGASFSIVSTSGQLQTKAALDYETKDSYTVTVYVSDGKGGSSSVRVTINVEDVTEPSNRITPVSQRTPQVRDAIVAAVRGVNSPDDVSTAHLAAITDLWIQNKNITSLKSGDFEGLTGMRKLRLQNNSISDISALEKLTSLTELYLSYNSIRDISPLKGLTSLTELSLSNNSIRDISALENLTKLTRLYLPNNSIRDISALDGLTNLERLYLYNNSIRDISALENLTKLTVLELWYNSIDDISALDGLTNLTWLEMYNNAVSDISPLEDLTKLIKLTLHNNSIDNISALDGLTNLTYLYLYNNTISDISPLEDLTKLKWLKLYNNSISDISALGGLTNLTLLTLNNNSIHDISALEGLTNLTWLKLHDNSIRDISALENLTVLTSLFLTGNPISAYAPLRRLIAAIAVIEGHSGLTLDITIPAVRNNNAPVFTDGPSTTRSVVENTAADTNIGTAVAATDADIGDTLTYHLGGTDASSFSIVSTSGQLQTKAALDYETKNAYTVTVAVSDGKGGSDSIIVSINVTDVVEDVDDENVRVAPSVEPPPVIPENTALLTNFPNPFNPETWIPYQLAKPAEVTLTIYDIRGVVVRELKLGHQAAGVYQSRSRAIHWDGRNAFGEKVATGVYFYTLKAGDFTATRKLLIRK